MTTTVKKVSDASRSAVGCAAMPVTVVRAGEAATRTGWADDVEVFWTRMLTERPDAIVDELAGTVRIAAFDNGRCEIVLPTFATVGTGTL